MISEKILTVCTCKESDEHTDDADLEITAGRRQTTTVDKVRRLVTTCKQYNFQLNLILVCSSFALRQTCGIRENDFLVSTLRLVRFMVPSAL